MRTAAVLTVLACGMTAALWLRQPPLAGSGAGAGLTAEVGLAAGTLAAGVLIGRSRPKAALVCGLALFAAALWCLAVAPGWLVLGRVAMGAVGLGAGIAFLSANALEREAAAGNPLAALCLLNLPLPLGVLLIPAIPPEAALRAAAAVATLALAAAAWTPAPPGMRAPAGSRSAVGRLALLLFLYAVCEAATWGWLAGYWQAARVLDRDTARTILWTALPLGLMTGRGASARLVAAIAPLTLVRYSGFGMAFAAALLLLARSPSASCIAAFVAGLAMGPVLPAVLGTAGGVSPRWPAAGMGIALSAGVLGMAAGPPLIAAVAQRSSLPTAMLLLPVASLAMALGARNRSRAS